MAVEYFVSVLRAKYAALSAADRKRAIRELVAESREQKGKARPMKPGQLEM